MTDRRRNLFVLLLVGFLLAGSIAVIAAKSTREGLDLKGGVELVYQAKPTKFSAVTGEAIQRSLDIMRDRVDQLGVAEPEIQRSGSDQIDVALPDVKNQQRAVNQVGTTAQMFFYDWEPNVLGPNCKANAGDPSVTGGQAAGDPSAGLQYYGAVVRAARCPAKPNQNTSHDAPNYYLVNDKTKTVVRGPEERQSDLFSESREKSPGPNESIRVVPPGVAVVEAQYDAKSEPKNPNQAKWFVLNDNFALRGTDIKNPEQNFDNGPGGTGAPIVTFNFTGTGRKIWHSTTRAIAQRGQSQQIPGQPAQQAFQHFAV